MEERVLAPYKVTLRTELIPHHYEVIEKIADYFELYGDLIGYYGEVPGKHRMGYVAAYQLEEVYATLGLTYAGNKGHVFVRLRSTKPFDGLAKVLEELHPDLHWG